MPALATAQLAQEPLEQRAPATAVKFGLGLPMGQSVDVSQRGCLRRRRVEMGVGIRPRPLRSEIVPTGDRRLPNSVGHVRSLDPHAIDSRCLKGTASSVVYNHRYLHHLTFLYR